MLSNRYRNSLLICFAAAILSTSSGRAAQLEWIGGTNDLWHTPTNWAPIDVPGQNPGV